MVLRPYFRAMLVLGSIACTSNAQPGMGQAASSSIVLTAYPDSPVAPETAEIRVTTPMGPLKVLGVEAVDPTRSLLIIMDPGATPREEARKFLSAVASHSGLRGNELPVRLGIALVGGILLDPIIDQGRLASEFERILQGYFPEPTQPGASGAGRFIDIVADLIARTQAQQGDLDCIIIGPDRFLEDEESVYLRDGLERKLLSILLDAGTTVYGYLKCDGILGELCVASGGLSFDSHVPPVDVVDRLLTRRGRGLRIRAELPAAAPLSGRQTVLISRPDLDESDRSWSGPQHFWVGLNTDDPPDYYRMRQALDWRRRSREAEQEGNLTVALRSVENALQEDPLDHESYCEAGRLAAASGDLVLASEYLLRAIADMEADEQALALYSSVQQRRGMAAAALAAIRSQRGIDDRLSRIFSARLLAKLNRHEESRALYEELLASAPPDDGLRGEYGRVLWALGEGGTAEEQLRAAVQADIGNLQALVGLSEVALAKGNPDEAADWAERALRKGPDDPDALVQLARVSQARGNLQAARSSLRRAVDLAPHRHDILVLLADVEFAAGRSEEARRILIGALAEYPDSPPIYRKLSELRLRTGDTASAAAVLEAGASRTAGAAHELYREAARWRERRGEYGQALLDYRATLESAPQEQAEALGKNLKDHLLYLSLLTGGGPESIPPAAAPLPVPPARGLGEERKANPAAAEMAQAPQDLLVPGGIDLLARAAGMPSSGLQGPEALTRLFSFILNASPAEGRKLEDHPVRREVVTHLRNYRSLMRHLSSKGILLQPDPTGQERLVDFSLAGSKADQEAAKRFLGFFGVKYKLNRSREGDAEIRIGLKEGRKHRDRQRLLHRMGINLLGETAQEVRIRLRDSRLHLPFDAATWKDKILGKKDVRDDELLEQMLLDLDAMRLYVALAGCSEDTRNALIEESAPRELVKNVEMLGLFGRFIDVRGSRVRFPGLASSWREFLGVSDNDGNAADLGRLVRQDRGRALALYFLLSVAPHSVREHFSSSRQNLAELCSLLPPVTSGKGSRLGISSYWILGRLMQLMGADERGAYLKLDPRLRPYIPNVPAAQSAAREHSIPLEVRELASLFPFLVKPDPQAPYAPIEVLEFLAQAQSEYPELLDEPALSAILIDPPAVPVFLDPVWNLRLPSDLAARYLSYCRSTALAQDQGWNVNRTRTSQALFHIIGLLHGQGTVTQDEGRRLLDELLAELALDDEASFSIRAAAFISLKLIPLLRSKTPGVEDASEVLWRALAGSSAKLSIQHEGSTADGDVAAFELERLKAAVREQEYLPLGDLVVLLNLLGELAESPTDTEKLERFTNRLAQLREPNSQPAMVKAIQRKPERAELAALRRSWAGLASRPAPSPSIPSELIRQTAAALHLELGVTLLTHCYAFEGAPETNPLIFDPLFVRRHRFYRNAQIKKGRWDAAQLESKDNRGTYIVGSLSGLGSQLGSLETAQLRGFGTDEDLTLLTILLSSMRSVPRILRSDRAQALVALTTRLGRESVTLASAHTEWLFWCERQFGELLLPKRRNQILRELRSGNPIGALRMLSPSELFQLGHSCLLFHGNPEPAVELSDPVVSPQGTALSVWKKPASPTAEPVPVMYCPLLDELNEILADPGLLAEEVAQYGVSLRRRMGLSQSSLRLLNVPFEQLDGWNRDDLLFERICDLKMQLAELGYSLGWPAAMAELLPDLIVLQDVRPVPGDFGTSGWSAVLGRISGLSHAHARRWVEECLNRGYLTTTAPEGSDSDFHERMKAPEVP